MKSFMGAFDKSHRKPQFKLVSFRASICVTLWVGVHLCFAEQAETFEPPSLFSKFSHVESGCTQVHVSFGHSGKSWWEPGLVSCLGPWLSLGSWPSLYAAGCRQGSLLVSGHLASDWRWSTWPMPCLCRQPGSFKGDAFWLFICFPYNEGTVLLRVPYFWLACASSVHFLSFLDSQTWVGFKFRSLKGMCYSEDGSLIWVLDVWLSLKHRARDWPHPGCVHGQWPAGLLEERQTHKTFIRTCSLSSPNENRLNGRLTGELEVEQ